MTAMHRFLRYQKHKRKGKHHESFLIYQGIILKEKQRKKEKKSNNGFTVPKINNNPAPNDSAAPQNNGTPILE